MADFEFLQNPISKKWVIYSPRRAHRPDVAKGAEPICPFCSGKEGEEKELYRVGGKEGDSNWLIRVLPNRFPFAPIHEIIIHSQDHHKNFGELPLSQAEVILETYRQRYNLHAKNGQVYVFHNRHEGAGESLPHPHTQLAVVPQEISLEIPRLANPSEMSIAAKNQQFQSTNHFVIFCPLTSQWPDEVWIVPKARGKVFGEIEDSQITDLAVILSRLIQIFDIRHGYEFPFNFYIYPLGDWYIRLIPRLKVLGGFEVGTGIFVNTQDPKETIAFIKEHFERPDEEKIQTLHQANYKKRV